ncbi:MAG: CoA transferase [Dehalococcoidia bacterium]|nr:CoA transferase [Dehalococcoidia bacterium]
MPDQALSRLVVLDLAENISGPYCTKLFADYGAEVIKVEKPPLGDPSRCAGPFPNDQPDIEKSGLFLFLNTGKKSITLNLESEDGSQIFKRLVKRADILVENFRPGVMASLGLDYEVLAEINPALIMTSISYFGQWGPYRDWDSSDIVAQAMGGLMGLTGEADREPLKLPLSQAEFQAGLNAAVATLSALYLRDETGDGQYIDVSLQEAVASILEASLTMYHYSGFIRERTGSRHHLQCPSRVMPAKDRLMHVQAGANWDHFSAFLEEPRLMEPRFASILRYNYADEVEELIQRRLEKRDSMELFVSGQEWRIPFALVLQIDELMGDPQHEARGFFQQIDHPMAGRLTYPGAPFKMSETPPVIRRAPLLGEQNEEVYAGTLGLSKENMIDLKEHGIT